MKEKEKHLEKNPNETNNWLDEQFKALVIRMLIKLRKINEHSENFNKELENIKNNQSELKNK